MDYIVTDLQASMPLVVWYSNFRPQVSELVCLTTEMFGAKGLTIAKDSSKCKKNAGKFVSVHAEREYGWSDGKAPLIFHLVARWWQVANFTPWPRYHRRKPRYPLNEGGG